MRPFLPPLGLSLLLSGCFPAFQHPVIENYGEVQILNEELRVVIEEMERRSPSFRAGMQAVRQSNLPILVGDKNQIAAYYPSTLSPANRKLAGFTAWFQDPGSELHVHAGLVMVDLELLKRMYETASDSAYQATLMGVLAHELYGHLVPVAQHHDYRRRCQDPPPKGPHQMANYPDSMFCVMRRENQIRAELGLETRAVYGVLYPWERDETYAGH